MTKGKKLNLIRVGLGDYAKSKTGLSLYKEILNCAKVSKAMSATVFKSIDGFLMKGNMETVRLFGGIDKSQGLIIEILISIEKKEIFLNSIRELCKTIDDPVFVSISDSDIEAFGLD